MVRYCWALGCKNNSNITDFRKVAYCTFPRDERLDIWLKNIGRSEFIDSPTKHDHVKNKRICSLHFEKKMNTTFGAKLKQNAIPTLLLPKLPPNLDESETKVVINTVTCSVPNCGNTTADCESVFFHFPINPEKCKTWLRNIKTEDMFMKSAFLHLENQLLVCGRHFDTKYINYYGNQLMYDAVPTLNLPISKIFDDDNTSTSEDSFIVYSTIDKNKESIPIARCEIVSTQPEHQLFWSKDESSIGEDVMVIPSKLDTNSTCRICLSANVTLIPLDQKANELSTPKKDVTYYEMLEECSLPLQVSEKIQLPTSICDKCSEDLVNLYCFTIIFKDSQETLKQYAEYIDQKEDPNYGKDLNKTVRNVPDIDVLMSEWAKSSGQDKKKAKNIEERQIKEEVIEIVEPDVTVSNFIKIENCNESSREDDDMFDMNEMLIVNKMSTSQVNENVNDNSYSILSYLLKTESNKDHEYAKTTENKKIKEKNKTVPIYKKSDFKLIKIEEDNSHLAQLPSERIPQFAHLEGGYIKVYACLDCDKKFYTVSGRRKHIKTYHQVQMRSYVRKKPLPQLKQEKSNTCEECGIHFENRRRYLQHRYKHKQKEKTKILYTCHICDKQLTSKTGLKEHLTLHENIKPYLCPTCGKTFRLQSALKTHEIIHLQNRPILKCPICQKPCTNRFRIKKCLDAHNEKKYQCDQCTKTFNSYTGYRTHIKKHETDKKMYQCEQCAEITLGLNNHKKHLRTHKITITKKCPYCKRWFLSDKLINAHCIDAHHNEDDILESYQGHECAACDVFCGSLEALLTHTKSCFDKYRCEKCPQFFDTPYMLILHSAKHRERNFSCRYCAKKYASSQMLYAHEKIHTMEKKFECSLCDKKFLYKQKLVEHLRIHSGEKIFKCKICLKSFSLKKNLLVHEFRHKNYRPYKCFECGMRFFDSSGRSKHCRQNHDGRGVVEIEEYDGEILHMDSLSSTG